MNTIILLAQNSIWPAKKLVDFTKDDISFVLKNITDISLYIAGGLAVLYVFIGAFYYVTAYGNEQKAETGKKTVMWAFIGVLIITVAKLVIDYVWTSITHTPITF